MIIQKTTIKRFRGFKDVTIELGTNLTAIAGQNGSQKTTILGLLTQPFTINDTSHPMYDERPLSGGNYKSAFAEKFKLSEEYDKPKDHEWTLFIDQQEPFTLESIPRGKNSGIRFWRKGDRSRGSGYIQMPVIFLSLKRLLPIGEDTRLEESIILDLKPDEIEFFKKWHGKILISRDEIRNTNYLESPDKNTLGISTDFYDWKSNSSGQDNIGKILLAILSFKRLKEKYPESYSGGILAIDELDATIYPASQLKLIDALRTFASKFSIQIIFTTHSLTILEKVCEFEQELAGKAENDQVKVIFLEKMDQSIKALQSVTFNSIRHKLNITIGGPQVAKINVFTEDKESATFAKALLKSRASKLKFINCTLGCGSLIDLGTRNIPSFSFPSAIVIVDGDVRKSPANMRKLKTLKNYLILPDEFSPERLLADFLYQLRDDSDVWEKIGENFTHQYCFKDISIAEIQSLREKAKSWFNSHVDHWGGNATRVINPWMKANKEIVDKFLNEFDECFDRFARELSL